MTTLRTAAQQAIALICSARLCEVNSMSSRQEMLRLMIEATDTLRAALAEPVQEQAEQALLAAFIGGIRALRDEAAKSYEESTSRGYKLHDLYRIKLDRLLAAVTSRVALAPPKAEPVQEPVAWSYELATTMLEHGYDGWEHLITRYKPNVPEGSIRNLTPLYTAPPQRKPLTDDQLDDIAVAARRGNLYDLRIAIDRAHETGDNDD